MDDLLKHPFFMDATEIDPNQPLSPELEALQALKYESENPVENARSYREEGNHFFKKKDFKRAIISYTAGLQINCEDSEMQAALFLNRATSQFHLGNYRKCITDANEALKLNPKYAKAHLRIAESLQRLHRHAELVEQCNTAMSVLGIIDVKAGTTVDAKSSSDAKNSDAELQICTRKLQEMKATAVKRLDAERAASDERDTANRAMRAEHDQLLTELHKRRVRVAGEIETGRVLLIANPNDANSAAKDESDSSNFFYAAQTGRVGRAQISYDTDRKELRWPILVMYPQFRQSDMLTEVYDSDLIASVLRTVLPETRDAAGTGTGTPHPEWDTEKMYSADHVETWFEHESSSRLVRVDPKWSILELASSNHFVVSRFGVVRLIVLLNRSESQFAREYIQKSGVLSD